MFGSLKKRLSDGVKKLSRKAEEAEPKAAVGPKKPVKREPVKKTEPQVPMKIEKQPKDVEPKKITPTEQKRRA
jgi:hypothetical protein